MKFDSQVVVVTGGAQGIGRSTCIRFVEEGAKVFIADINDAKGQELEKLLIQNGGEAHYIHADISNEEDIIHMSQSIANLYPNIHVLVNCAVKGIIKGIDATVQEWQDVFLTNVIGYAMCIKHCLPMMKHVNASVINIASISGFIAQPEYLTYNTTKGALVNMTRCLAMDLSKYGIRVNNVCPGTIWTENNAYYIQRDFGVDYEQANHHPEIGGKHLLHRVGLPVEVANSILFLASTDASFITGENLMVDGGYLSKS